MSKGGLNAARGMQHAGQGSSVLPVGPAGSARWPASLVTADAAQNTLLNGAHAGDAGHTSDDALLDSLTPQQVREYLPPPAPSHARAPRSEIPSDRSLRQKAFTFLTSKAGAPPAASSGGRAAAGGGTDSAESAADFITGYSAAAAEPPPPPQGDTRVPLFKNVARGVYNVAAKAAADVDALIEVCALPTRACAGVSVSVSMSVSVSEWLDSVPLYFFAHVH